jgi:hypothetical protein
MLKPRFIKDLACLLNTPLGWGLAELRDGFER